jgi:hypothetical protein
MLDQVTTPSGSSPLLYRVDKPSVVFQHAGNGVLHQFLGSASGLDGQIVKTRFLGLGQTDLHAFKASFCRVISTPGVDSRSGSEGRTPIPPESRPDGTGFDRDADAIKSTNRATLVVPAHIRRYIHARADFARTNTRPCSLGLNQYTSAEFIRSSMRLCSTMWRFKPESVQRLARQTWSAASMGELFLGMNVFGIFALLAMALLPAQGATPQEKGQPFRLQPGDFRWVPFTIRQIPAEVDCHFEVVNGNGNVHAELLPLSEFRLFDRGEDHATLATTPNEHSGDFRRVLETPGQYVVVVVNADRGSPVTVSLQVRTNVNPDSKDVARTLPPERRLTVILISFAFFFATVAWSGRKLRRAMRNP